MLFAFLFATISLPLNHLQDTTMSAHLLTYYHVCECTTSSQRLFPLCWEPRTWCQLPRAVSPCPNNAAAEPVSSSPQPCSAWPQALPIWVSPWHMPISREVSNAQGWDCSHAPSYPGLGWGWESLRCQAMPWLTMGAQCYWMVPWWFCDIDRLRQVHATVWRCN